MLAHPTAKPAKQAASAESPNGVLWRKRSPMSPAPKPTTAPASGPPTKPAQTASSTMKSGATSYPQVVAERGLQEDPSASRTADLEDRPGPGRAHSTDPAHPVWGDHSRTRTNCRLTRSARG